MTELRRRFFTCSSSPSRRCVYQILPRLVNQSIARCISILFLCSNCYSCTLLTIFTRSSIRTYFQLTNFPSIKMLLSFNVDTFNSAVGDFHDVRRYGDKNQDLNAMGPTIERFGNLFRKYGKQDHLALSLAHRHFQLHEGERKVAKHNKIKSSINIGPTTGEKAQILPY